jgi:signal transduction histidine kinase
MVRRRTAELEDANRELAAAVRDLSLAQAQLVHSEKMASLGVLVAGVAHEINNPVSFIVGNVPPLRETLAEVATRAAALRDPEVDAALARVVRAFDVIARGAERTAAVVDDLRTFSRLGEAQPMPTDVHDGLDVTLRLLRPRWSGRITVHREYGTLPRVEAVPGQLNQVFMNLLANACDAIADTGNLWIRTSATDDEIEVLVRDDGAGIAPDDLERIFDPFFTTKPQGQGTGLGLAISHGIVVHHGGRLLVESTPGAGATFRLVLPRRRRSAAA